MCRRFMLVLGVFVGLSLAFAGTAAAQQGAEGGDYYVTGTNPDGSTYTGGLEILQLGAETYQVSWQLAVPAYGVGLLNGNVFGVIVGGSECAISLYTSTETGLDGRWTSVEMSDAYAESAALTSASDTVLEYTLQGQNADGTTYSGTMTMTAVGDALVVEQQVGDTTLTGTALLVGDVLAVGFGSASCTLAIYTVGADSTLSGAWLPLNSTVLGTESAVPIDISGAHTVTGTNPDGTTYSGTLDIAVDNQVHTFTWNTGGTVINGVGIMRGSSVAVGFGGANCSVASYFQQPSDRMLSGLWTVVGENQVGSEIAFPTSEPSGADPYVGTYDIIGTNMGDTSGNTYTGTLEIVPHDQVYELIWTFGQDTVYGVGIVSNGILVSGYGGDTCAVNGYFVNPNDMRGTWAVYGTNTVGTETASR